MPAPNYAKINAALTKSPHALNQIYDYFDYEPQSVEQLLSHLTQFQSTIHLAFIRYVLHNQITDRSTEAIQLRDWVVQRYWEFYDLLTQKLVHVFGDAHETAPTEQEKYKFLALWTEEWKFIFTNILSDKDALDFRKIRDMAVEKLCVPQMFENDALMEWVLMVLVDQYWDAWLLWMFALQNHVHQNHSNLNQLKRVLNLIVGLKVPHVGVGVSADKFLAKHPRREFTTPAQYQQAFIDLWQSILLRSDLDDLVYMHILNRLNEDVIPHFGGKAYVLNPFIQRAFERGGEPALLSVQSLFTLMSKHGLVVNDFYSRLYALIHPSIFDVPDQVGQFLDFLEMALSSSKITEQILVAFCKKIARVALASPLYATQYWVRLISVLLHKYEFLHELVQRDDALYESMKNLGRYQLQMLYEQGKLDEILEKITVDHSDSMEVDEEEEDNSTSRNGRTHPDKKYLALLRVFTKLLHMKPQLVTKDEFDELKTQPEESNAAQSSLWELETLSHHALRDVTKETKKLKKMVNAKVKTLVPVTKDLKIDMSYDALFLQMIGSTHNHYDLKSQTAFEGRTSFRE